MDATSKLLILEPNHPINLVAKIMTMPQCYVRCSYYHIFSSNTVVDD
ncbi:uncharacterized protein METZ01_LOCUS212403 [marine metagenome]|uniref:Uncharacterized protein n=1 Tax=marine metagenome TaxID=408172 RepID=A0A382FA64_9ZZZZ